MGLSRGEKGKKLLSRSGKTSQKRKDWVDERRIRREK